MSRIGSSCLFNLENCERWCQAPLLLFSFCVVFKRFSCQLYTFSVTPSKVLFPFFLGVIDNILVSVYTNNKAGMY